MGMEAQLGYDCSHVMIDNRRGLKHSGIMLSGGEEAPRSSVYVYTTLIGLLGLGIFLQFMDFGERLDRPRSETVAAATPGGALARDRARRPTSGVRRSWASACASPTTGS